MAMTLGVKQSDSINAWSLLKFLVFASDLILIPRELNLSEIWLFDVISNSSKGIFPASKYLSGIILNPSSLKLGIFSPESISSPREKIELR